MSDLSLTLPCIFNLIPSQQVLLVSTVVLLSSRKLLVHLHSQNLSIWGLKLLLAQSSLADLWGDQDTNFNLWDGHQLPVTIRPTISSKLGFLCDELSTQSYMDLALGNDGPVDEAGVHTSGIVGTRNNAIFRQNISSQADWTWQSQTRNLWLLSFHSGTFSNPKPARRTMITTLLCVTSLQKLSCSFQLYLFSETDDLVRFLV